MVVGLNELGYDGGCCVVGVGLEMEVWLVRWFGRLWCVEKVVRLRWEW